MNHYQVQFFCGQIKYVENFFKNYRDNWVETHIKVINKLKAIIFVETKLQAEEAKKHLERVFKESKYGCALHFNTVLIDGTKL